jgi:2-haloacid dehalogenase
MIQALKIQALVFDVFGTLVDWRGSLASEAAAWKQRKGLRIDPVRFADRWRSGYRPAMDRVRRGEIPWTNLDGLHRMIFDEMMAEFSIGGLSEAEKSEWCRAWWRLNPWPDTVAGMTALRKNFLLASLSNGNIALIAHLARHSEIPFDASLGAELVRHYKPDAEVYLAAPGYLGVPAEQIMMIAAHASDLEAARRCGLRTGFLHRLQEFGDGPVGVADRARAGDFDVVADDAVDLARQLGA